MPAMSLESDPLNAAVRTDPVTVLISRVVTPGRENDYRQWLIRMITAAEAAPNNLGVVVLSPEASASNVFSFVHRFADEAALEAWENSDTLRSLLTEAEAFSTLHRQVATGMEAWFTLAGPSAPTVPPRWKMAVLTFVIVYVLTAIIIPIERAVLPESWSFFATNILTNALIALLLTYLILPATTKLLHPWLYHQPPPA
jgi:antibiotic biosynthesis monooxygenase (ABM) superfamily enzyme